MMVYGGGFFSLFTLSVALARGDIALLFVALLLFCVAFHFWPFVRSKDPALVVSSAGLKVTGLGTLAWDAISDASMVDKAVRTIRNSELHLSLSRPLEAALVEENMGGIARRLMTQIWRYKDDKIILRLEPLDVTSDPILETVQRFLSR
ncbi:MAG: hypothetical protein COA62_12030 [Rhodobiaceae bacterium]|nr:MAG: hypothetical protein COA62_12030 [Rhodobiaceae bacterium]